MRSEKETIKEIATLLHKNGSQDYDCDGDCDNCWCCEKKMAEKLYELRYRKITKNEIIITKKEYDKLNCKGLNVAAKYFVGVEMDK